MAEKAEWELSKPVISAQLIQFVQENIAFPNCLTCLFSKINPLLLQIALPLSESGGLFRVMEIYY